MARNKYDIDETLEQSYDFRKLKRALVYVKPYTSRMLLVLILAVLSSALSLLAPTLLEKAMDVAIPQKDKGLLIRLGISLLTVTVLGPILNAVHSYMMTHIGQNMILDIRTDVFHHLQKLPFSYYDSRPHGKILVRVVNYVNNVSDTLSNGMVNAILDLIKMLLILVYMFLLSPRLSLVILAGMPLLIAIIFYLKKKQKRANFIFNNKNSNLTAYTCEHIEGVKVTEIFARQKENNEIYEKLNDEYRHTYFRRLYLTNALGPISENIRQWIVSLVYVFGVLVFSPRVEVGVIIAMASYANRFWQPVINLAGIYNNLLITISYLERIFQLLDEPVDIEDGENAEVLTSPRGEVTFDHVSFSYEKGIKVLKDVSFHIAPGQSVALVGETGGGKSTIVNLISRFYDTTEGAVLVDGKNVRDLTLDSLRQSMGIMMQDSFIFSGTVADNIRYGRPDATDEEVKAAARAVCADGFIEEMPDGYQTLIGERGGNISEGQKQLIALARTMVSDPAIIILDEATSSIDAKTEKLLKQGIDTLLKGRTSFIIAHRLATIRHCDCIFVIDRGCIVEEGTHDELMALKGRYYHLCTVQSGETKPDETVLPETILN